MIDLVDGGLDLGDLADPQAGVGDLLARVLLEGADQGGRHRDRLGAAGGDSST